MPQQHWCHTMKQILFSHVVKEIQMSNHFYWVTVSYIWVWLSSTVLLNIVMDISSDQLGKKKKIMIMFFCHIVQFYVPAQNISFSVYTYQFSRFPLNAKGKRRTSTSAGEQQQQHVEDDDKCSCSDCSASTRRKEKG